MPKDKSKAKSKTKPNDSLAALPCPCGRPQPYAECCARYHAGTPAPDAEALMRSRYSAYVLSNADYLRETWHPDTRPESLDLDDARPPKWLGLEVVRHEQADAEHALVEFIARFKVDGRAHRMHETSRFLHIEGRWFYRDGEVSD